MNTKQLINLPALGTATKLAKTIGVTDAAISLWVKNNRIPPLRLQILKLTHPDLPWHKYRPAKKAGSK